jgi:hypothetical protein
MLSATTFQHVFVYHFKSVIDIKKKVFFFIFFNNFNILKSKLKISYIFLS